MMTDWFGGKRVGSLQDEINRVFTDFGFTPPPGMGAAFGGLSSQPRVEVEKTKTGYEIEIAFPFPIGAEQIQAEFREGKLVITAERPPAQSGAKVDIRTGGSSGAQGGSGSSSGGAESSSGPGGMMGEGSSGGDTGRAGGMMGEGG